MKITRRNLLQGAGKAETGVGDVGCRDGENADGDSDDQGFA